MTSSQTPWDILSIALGQLSDLISKNDGVKTALSIVQDWAKKGMELQGMHDDLASNSS